MRPTIVAALLTFAGCDRIWQLDDVPPPRDAAADPDGMDVDGAPDARTCFGSPQGLFQSCLTAPLDGPVALGGVLNTSSDSRCRQVTQSTGEPACVIAAESITIANALVVRGSKALVLIGADFIRVDAPLDASSTSGRSGPGSQTLNQCGTSGNGTNAAAGGGGGAGGTFGYPGGFPQPGGGVDDTAHSSDAVVPLLDVRGGCPGYTAGVATSSGATGAKGGDGGGAVYLIAGNRIDVGTNAPIDASGSGGSGGPVRGGGGGGGSGGLIALDAPTVVVASELFARGGGGGSGGSDSVAGGSGSEPTGATGNTPGGVAAAGTGSGPGWPGCGGPDGEQGGNNAAGTAAAGGGGGGGACGYIFVYAETKTIDAPTSPTVKP